jgi:hypothetical protein
MKCIECKWFAGSPNDQYGLCKRYPTAQNKTQHDWCGDFSSKVVVITPAQKEPVQKLEIKFEEPTEYEYDIHTDEAKPKRGRKPKA